MYGRRSGQLRHPARALLKNLKIQPILEQPGAELHRPTHVQIFVSDCIVGGPCPQVWSADPASPGGKAVLRPVVGGQQEQRAGRVRCAAPSLTGAWASLDSGVCGVSRPVSMGPGGNC